MKRQQQKRSTPVKVASASVSASKRVVIGGFVVGIAAAAGMTAAVAPPVANSRPSTLPSMPQTSQPAPPADFSTPKAAATSLFLALSRGEREVVVRALYAADADQRALADAMADLLINGKRLGDAARDRFGRDADAIGRGMLDPSDLSRLRDATVKESADTATIQVQGQPRPMSFRRNRDGQWALVVTDFGGAAPDNVARQTRLVRMMAEAMNESAREVASGKFATPDAATAAIQRRLHEVMLNFTRPATTRAATTASPTTSP
jgi:hypothetical protein